MCLGLQALPSIRSNDRLKRSCRAFLSSDQVEKTSGIKENILNLTYSYHSGLDYRFCFLNIIMYIYKNLIVNILLNREIMKGYSQYWKGDQVLVLIFNIVEVLASVIRQTRNK